MSAAVFKGIRHFRPCSSLTAKHLSETARKPYTHHLKKRFESYGYKPEEAAAIATVLTDRLEYIHEAYATKAELDRELEIKKSQVDTMLYCFRASKDAALNKARLEFIKKENEMRLLEKELPDLLLTEAFKMNDELDTELIKTKLKLEETKFELCKGVFVSLASMIGLGVTVYHFGYM